MLSLGFSLSQALAGQWHKEEVEALVRQLAFVPDHLALEHRVDVAGEVAVGRELGADGLEARRAGLIANLRLGHHLRNEPGRQRVAELG